MSGAPDLERHDVVGQAAEGEGPGEQVEHQAAVHGEQLVVGLEGDQRRGRVGQLGPDDQGHDAGDEEEHQRGDHVALADHLVVGGGQPVEDPGRALVVGVLAARAVAPGVVAVGTAGLLGLDQLGGLDRWWSCGSLRRGGRGPGVGRGDVGVERRDVVRPGCPIAAGCVRCPTSALGPGAERRRAHRPHAEQHLGVVEPADLGALAVVGARRGARRGRSS